MNRVALDRHVNDKTQPVRAEYEFVGLRRILYHMSGQVGNRRGAFGDRGSPAEVVYFENGHAFVVFHHAEGHIAFLLEVGGNVGDLPFAVYGCVGLASGQNRGNECHREHQRNRQHKQFTDFHTPSVGTIDVSIYFTARPPRCQQTGSLPADHAQTEEKGELPLPFR